MGMLIHHRSSGESADQLIAAASTHGFRISKTQLVRWHRVGLLPRPRQSGLGRGRGTESIYPPGTTRLLLDLCAIRKHERRFSVIAWKLWWSGHDALTKQIRRSLQHFVVEWERVSKQWMQNGELTDDGANLLDQTQNPRNHGKVLRQLRRRVGYHRILKFMRVVMQVVSGEFSRWDGPGDPEIIARGLRPTKEKHTPDTLQWVLDPIALGELSQRISPEAIGRALDRTTDQDLTRAQNAVRELFSSSMSIVSTLGLGTLPADISEDLWGQKALVLVWIAFQSNPVSAIE